MTEKEYETALKRIETLFNSEDESDLRELEELTSQVEEYEATFF